MEHRISDLKIIRERTSYRHSELAARYVGTEPLKGSAFDTKAMFKLMNKDIMVFGIKDSTEVKHYQKGSLIFTQAQSNVISYLKDSRMGHCVKVSLWCVSLLINTRFRFLILVRDSWSSG